jgi:hypothetical protein
MSVVMLLMAVGIIRVTQIIWIVRATKVIEC